MNVLSSRIGSKSHALQKLPMPSAKKVWLSYTNNIEQLSPTKFSIINKLARLAFAISALVPYIIVTSVIMILDSNPSDKFLSNKKILTIATLSIVGYWAFQVVKSLKSKDCNYIYPERPYLESSKNAFLSSDIVNVFVNVAIATSAVTFGFFIIRSALANFKYIKSKNNLEKFTKTVEITLQKATLKSEEIGSYKEKAELLRKFANSKFEEAKEACKSTNETISKNKSVIDEALKDENCEVIARLYKEYGDLHFESARLFRKAANNYEDAIDLLIDISGLFITVCSPLFETGDINEESIKACYKSIQEVLEDYNEVKKIYKRIEIECENAKQKYIEASCADYVINHKLKFDDICEKAEFETEKLCTGAYLIRTRIDSFSNLYNEKFYSKPKIMAILNKQKSN